MAKFMVSDAARAPRGIMPLDHTHGNIVNWQSPPVANPNLNPNPPAANSDCRNLVAPCQGWKSLLGGWLLGWRGWQRGKCTVPGCGRGPAPPQSGRWPGRAMLGVLESAPCTGSECLGQLGGGGGVVVAWWWWVCVGVCGGGVRVIGLA
jgi:hypothetical protein